MNVAIWLVAIFYVYYVEAGSLNLTVQVFDLVHTVTWSTPDVHSRIYNVYARQHFEDPWSIVPNCINVDRNNCTLKIKYIASWEMEIKVEDNRNISEEITVKDLDSLAADDLLKFSLVDFDIIRHKDLVEVQFHASLVPWWGCTIIQFITQSGFEVYYQVDYLSTQTNEIKPGETGEHLLVEGESNSTTFHLPFADETGVCARVRLVFGQNSIRQNGEWNRKCIEGDNVGLLQISETKFQKYKIPLILGMCAVFFGILVSVMFLCGKKLMRFHNKICEPQHAFLHESIVLELRNAKSARPKMIENSNSSENAALFMNIRPLHVEREHSLEHEKIDYLEMGDWQKQTQKEESVAPSSNIPHTSTKSCESLHVYVNENENFVSKEPASSNESIPYLMEEDFVQKSDRESPLTEPCFI